MASSRSVKEQLGVDLPEPEPVEAPEVVDDRPEWLPEKFKDASEFAESYRNLESELTSRAESQKNLEQRIDQLTMVVENFPQAQQQQQGYAPQQDPQQVSEQLMAAYENDPIGTMIFLANTAADQRLQQFAAYQQPQAAAQQHLQGELIADNASRLLQARYPDWSEYEPQIGQMIERNPTLLPVDVLGSLERTTSTLESIYKQAKYDDLVEQLGQAQAGQANGETMKRQAQTVSGASGRPQLPSDTDLKMDQLLAAAKGSSYSAWRGGS